MKGLLRRLKRAILLARIDSLRSDIAIAEERRVNAELSVESASQFIEQAHRKMRLLRSRLVMLDRPDDLVAMSRRWQ